MNILNYIRSALRNRFIAGISAMVLPVMLLAIIGHGFLLPNITNSFDKVIEGVTEELHPVLHLETGLRDVAAPLNNYLILGNQEERKIFNKLSEEVDDDFKELTSKPFALSKEWKYIRLSEKEWRKAKKSAGASYLSPIPLTIPAPLTRRNNLTSLSIKPSAIMKKPMKLLI